MPVNSKGRTRLETPRQRAARLGASGYRELGADNYFSLSRHEGVTSRLLSCISQVPWRVAD